VSWTAVEYTSESNAAWQQVSFALSDYFPVPGLVQLRFIAEDTGGGSLVEAAVDDFSLVGDFGGTTAIGEPAPGAGTMIALGQNAPNPFNPHTEIRFTLGRETPAALTVFDPRGRFVKQLLASVLPRGEHSVIWDGRDRYDQPVTSGVYLYVLEAAGQRTARSMLLLK
jgi:hypothetical protein